MNTTVSMKSLNFQPDTKDKGILFEEVVTVKRIIAVSVGLMVFILTALGVSTAQSAPRGFGSSFDSAVSRSQSSGRPVFAVIARTGCPACAELERELNRVSSQRALASSVKVRLEADQYPDMVARYAAGGTPTILVFAPGNYKNPVYSYTGVMSGSTISQVGNSLNALGSN